MKILNLYAGIGGNRKLWGDEHEVTAIEWDKEIAKIYIVCDAHRYLLEHFEEFDFIWSSPPCPSHSRIRKNTSVARGQSKPVFPDMKLYEEILFLRYYFKGEWVVENVKPYYEPLIKTKMVGRHLFWSNFIIQELKSKTLFYPKDSLPKLQEVYGVDLTNLKIDMDKRTILRNMVHPELGLHVLKCAFKEQQQTI